MGEFTLNASKTLISFQQVQNSWWHETQHAFLVDSSVNVHIASLSLMQHGKPDLVLVRGLAQDKVHKVRNSQQVMRHCGRHGNMYHVEAGEELSDRQLSDTNIINIFLFSQCVLCPALGQMSLQCFFINFSSVSFSVLCTTCFSQCSS